MQKILSLVFLLTSLGSLGQTPAPSVETVGSEDSFVICRNQKIVRTFRIEKKNGRYLAIYTKNGEDRIIGNAQKLFVCLDVIKSVKENLVKAGWKCKEIKKGDITRTQDEEAKPTQ